jgi:hypothetical protein
MREDLELIMYLQVDEETFTLVEYQSLGKGE